MCCAVESGPGISARVLRPPDPHCIVRRMATLPKVSVIVPSYNHAPYLAQRLDSILTQTFQDFELIFLDDASPDHTREVFDRYAQNPRIRAVFNERNSGNVFKQWNRGLAMAQGEYVWIAESDDYADPEFLATLVGLLDQHPGLGVAYCESRKVNSAGEPLGLASEWYGATYRTDRWRSSFVADGAAEARDYSLAGSPIANASCALFRRALAHAAGGAPEHLRLTGDWLFWVTLFGSAKVAFECRPLNFYRHHDGSVSSRSVRSGVDLEEFYRVANHVRSRFSPAPDLVERTRTMLFDRWFWRSLRRDAEITWGRQRRIYFHARQFDPGIGRRFAARWLRTRTKGVLSKLRSRPEARPKSSPETKRLLFITTNEVVPWGGSELLWCQTAARLLEAGHAVAVSVPEWDPQPEPHQALARAGALMLPRPPGHGGLLSRGIRKLLSQSSLGSMTARHLAQLDDFRPDLCVVSEGSNLRATEWLEALHARGWPTVCVSQAVNLSQWPEDHMRGRLIRAYSQLRRSYYVAQANLEDTQRQLGTALSNAEVVRNPFGVAFDAAPPWNRNPGPLRLAVVGRMHPPAKGQELIIEVMALPHWRQRDVTLTFFGEGPQAEALKSLANWRGLTNVTFAGYEADVAGIWAEHHALVLPSRYEGLPLVVVEAMLCGRSCIVTRVGGNAELIEDNVTGFVAAAPTVDLIDEAMNRAWERRGELEVLGRRAAEAARTMVPKDPAGAFAEKLLGLIANP